MSGRLTSPSVHDKPDLNNLSRLLDSPDYRPTEKPTKINDFFLKMPNLRSVHLFFDSTNDVYASDMEDFITQFPFWLQGCKRLSEVQVEIPTYGLNSPWRRRLIQGVFERIFKKTGVQGEFIKLVYDGLTNGCTYTEAEM